MLQQTSRIDDSSNVTLEQQPLLSDKIEDGFFQAESPVFNKQQRFDKAQSQAASEL